MNKLDKVEKIVRSVLADRFEDIKILSIDVTPDVDEDGEKVLFVKVVFDGVHKQLPARETSGLARRILPKFSEIGEKAFPIFSFIAKSELRKRNPETV